MDDGQDTYEKNNLSIAARRDDNQGQLIDIIFEDNSWIIVSPWRGRQERSDFLAAGVERKIYFRLFRKDTERVYNDRGYKLLCILVIFRAIANCGCAAADLMAILTHIMRTAFTIYADFTRIALIDAV